MALIKCSGCGHMVSDKGMKCPKCGTPIHKVEEVAKPIEEKEKVIAEVESPKVEIPKADKPINESLKDDSPISESPQVEIESPIGEYEDEPQRSKKTIVAFVCGTVVIAAMVGVFFMWHSNKIGETDNSIAANDSVSTVEVPDSSQDIKVKADTTTETTIESVEEESLEYEPIADADESLTEYTDEELFAKGKEYFFNESFDDNISSKAFPLFQIAANRGYAPAQCYLGWCYAIGTGVKANAKEAVKWYRKSAENGDAGGQMRYAGCLEHGEGIAEDIEEALYWYGKAAEQGVEIARVKLKSYQRIEE